MVDQGTAGIERSMADMLLAQVAEAGEKFRAEMETMAADLSRLSGELGALERELEAIEKEPGDHRKEVEEIEKKINERQAAIDRISDEMKARNLVYEAQIKLLTELLAGWNKIVKNAADKIGR